MNLTIYDLDSLRQCCDRVSQLCTEIKKAYNPTSYERKLFVSRADYDECLKQKNEIPQDFYFFRCFDVFIQIVFNKKSKKYQIYVDGFYSKILNKYSRVQRSDKSYEISENFDDALLVFQDLINDCLSARVLQNGLF